MKKTLTLITALFMGAYAYAAKPNVVIIYADDMGYGDVSYGDKDWKIQTPTLDALAASGMTFLDGHSSSGICTPSRFALLTGQHHWRRMHDIVKAFGDSVFKPDDFTIAKMLKSKGYNTAAVGKWHLGWDWQAIAKEGVKPEIKGKKKASSEPDKYYSHEQLDWSKKIPMGPTAQGFDYYFGDGTINFPPYCWIENDKAITAPTTNLNVDNFKKLREGNWECRAGPMLEGWNPYEVLPTVTDKAVAWINQQSAETPFFLYFALPSPHAPILPTEDFKNSSKAGAYGDYVVESDAMAAKVIKALEDKGFIDNTLIIFSADNGAEHYAYDRQKNFKHWSSFPFRGSKRDLFEGGHHVPFIMSWKGNIPAGTKTDEVVNQVDIAATLAEIVGYDLSKIEAKDSYSLLPVMKQEDYTKPLRYATVQNTSKGNYALRQGDWVYMNTTNGGTSAGGKKNLYIPSDKKVVTGKTAGLLYNLKEDIAQTTNVYAKHPEKVKSMKKILDAYIKGKPCAPHAQ